MNSYSVLEALNRIANALEKQNELVQLANNYNAELNDKQLTTNAEILKAQKKIAQASEEATELNKIRMVSKGKLS